MRTEAYTSINICRCLGLVGFEADPQLSEADEAIRLLLMPSFHPEICITIADGRASVVTAKQMIWHLLEPALVLTDRDEGEIPEEHFSRLLAMFNEGASLTPDSGMAIDGMPVDSLLFRDGSLLLKGRENVGIRSHFAAFSAQVISEVWNCLENVYCRNALAEAGKYVGLNFPLAPEPQRQPTVGTLILGLEEDRIQLMKALRKPRGS